MAKKYYIGNREIEGFSELEQTTPLGNKVLEVRFQDGTSELMTERTYQNLRSDQVVDDHRQMFLNKARRAAEEVLILMSEVNFRVDEIDPFLTLVAESVNENLNRASDKLWGVDGAHERTLLLVDRVLKDNGREEDSD